MESVGLSPPNTSSRSNLLFKVVESKTEGNEYFKHDAE